MYYTNVSLSKELKGGCSSHTVSLRPDDDFQGPCWSLKPTCQLWDYLQKLGLFGAKQFPELPKIIPF